MRYFIEFSYDGTDFSGMQIQPNALSIQEVLENALSKKLRFNCRITAAGRTDSGVHAKQMYAHFDTELEIETSKLIYELNSFLPKSIAVLTLQKVEDKAHARFDAISRTYNYYISLEKNPFSERFSYQLYKKKLDIDKMNEASILLKKYTDFTSFSKLHTDTKTNNCKIIFAEWKIENSHLIFTITADRFLRNMVRSIVGTLLDIGEGKINLHQFCTIIEQKDRKFAGISAPAKGLILSEIKYDFLKIHTE